MTDAEVAQLVQLAAWAAPLAAVWLLVRACRTKRGRRRWLWRPLAYIGFCRWLTRPTAAVWRARRRPRRVSLAKPPRRARPAATPLVDEPSLLYRHWDGPNCTGRLLYIGITREHRGGRRWEEHAADKHWFHLVESSRVERHPSWSAALYAEAVAIERENPVYNVSRPNPRLMRRPA